MSLKEILNGVLADVDGALAAIVMASDGIPVDEVVAVPAEYDIQLLAVEYATVLKEIRRAVDVIKAGNLEEVSIATAQMRVVVRVLNEDLFAALILTRDGNFGKGRYLLKLKCGDLMRELT